MMVEILSTADPDQMLLRTVSVRFQKEQYNKYIHKIAEFMIESQFHRCVRLLFPVKSKIETPVSGVGQEKYENCSINDTLSLTACQVYTQNTE